MSCQHNKPCNSASKLIKYYTIVRNNKFSSTVSDDHNINDDYNDDDGDGGGDDHNDHDGS